MIVWHTTAGTFVGEDQQAILVQFGPDARYEPDHHLRPEAVGRIVTNDRRWITLALVLVENGPAPTAAHVAAVLDEAEPMIHPNLCVEATHYTGSPESPRMACEVYPGVIVANRGGVYSVLTVAHIFAALPPEHAGATFVLGAHSAWLAADMYDSLMEGAKNDPWYAATRSAGIEPFVWPPRGWESRSTYTATRSGHPIGQPRE